MKLYEAVAYRIIKLCEERNISINKLASMSCLTQSTVQHLTDGRSKNPKMLTMAKICCTGLNMSLSEFFDDPAFDNLDLED